MNMSKNGIKWQMFWYNISLKMKGILLNMEIFVQMPEKFSIALVTVNLETLPHCFPLFFNLKNL